MIKKIAKPAILWLLPAIIFFFICISTASLAQMSERADNEKLWGDWQISLNFGAQMSGIKNEDFVASNYAPLLNVSFGKWFSPVIALEAGYKGWYFRTISDDDKHNYGYYYGAAILNVKALLRGYDEGSIWLPWLHAGSGYFYNHYFERPNICADLVISNNFRLSKKLSASMNISAIIGWDIYQGDEDILPGLTVGMRYLF